MPESFVATALEVYEGGSAEHERKLFEQFARDIMDTQVRLKNKAPTAKVRRAFHAKVQLASAQATLQVLDSLPPDLAVHYVQPGACYGATVRLSNASGRIQSDHTPDLRGVAVRVHIDDAVVHDILLTNFPVSHARNARQFVIFARASAGHRWLLCPRLVWHLGPREALRMLRNLLTGTRRPVHSLATETYWSRSAIGWGAKPVRVLLRPLDGAPSPAKPVRGGPDYLREDILRRLRDGDVQFELCVQRFVDEHTTPVEDAAVEWRESVAPPVPIARLTLRSHDPASPAMRAEAGAIEAMAFNPWNAPDAFRPLGNLNRARKAVYEASAHHRAERRFHYAVPVRGRVLGALTPALFRRINVFIPWHRLPAKIGLLNLAGFRHVMRNENLLDSERREAPPRTRSLPEPVPEGVQAVRTFDGSFNDLSSGEMGRAGALFGRNMAPAGTSAGLLTPNPVEVSAALLERKSFIEATALNLLAAAWVQFEVHDWVNHERFDLGDDDIVIPMPGGARWKNHRDQDAETVMRIAGNRAANPKGPHGCPVFRNTNTHWWDGSQVYGSSKYEADRLRDGPFIRLDDGYLPTPGGRVPLTGFNDNWWLGLSALHTLFAREHNSVCRALQSAYPTWQDERVYQTARLVVAALIAKIHTIQWTPAILATETLDLGMHTNWSGARDWFSKLVVALIEAQALNGIPGSLPEHHSAPYSLTEEFVSVYRMHPLIPDDFVFWDAATGARKEERQFDDVAGRHSGAVIRRLELSNVLYSFGIGHPGAVTLHNYPRALRRFERHNGEIIDVAVVDLVRDRARGVPRYNDFRERLHKTRLRDWEQLSDHPDDVDLLRECYRNIDAVDTMVGMFAEAPPAGFGFSDTAFRIFILMASRRLQSDRFLTVDFRPEMYSPLGMDWVRTTTMGDVILRHCPELAATLPRSGNPFAPWRVV